jgi:deoxyribose-phosphate aldolase
MPLSSTDIQQLASMIDHTLLKPEATAAQVEQLCDEARRFSFASVCVNPTHVKLCARLLRGSPVRVCTVVGFPLGANLPEVKVFETQQAIHDGATEIDMVINVGALKDRNIELVARDIAAIVNAAHALNALVKVILEVALLTDEEKVTACRLAKEAGADYVKTSTGFGPGGATAPDVALMRQTVGPEMGVKAAGGIRTLADAQKMMAAGATRIGASASVKIMAEAGAA